MVTYYTTQEAAIKAAQEAKRDTYNTFVKHSSYQCCCGESFACYLIDRDTLNTLEMFVHCEYCHDRH